MTDPMNDLIDQKRIHIQEWKWDPDYLDDIRDPARAAKGLLRGFLLGIPFWVLLCGLIALANKYIGGG